MIRRTALVLAALAALTGCGSGGSSTVRGTAAGSATLHGAIPSSHDAKPSLVLTDTSGHRYDFRAETDGRVALLYFGYTHCPDECPTAMADLAAALRRVSPDVRRQVSVVFVTTDPWRDTKPVLRRWLDRFDPSFVGLTGTPSQIRAAEVRMGMQVSRREPAKKSYGAGRYAVAHFAAVMVYGSDNRLATLYPSGVTPADIAADLPELVKG